MSRLGSALLALVTFAAVNTAFAADELVRLMSSNTLVNPQAAIGMEGASSHFLPAFLVVPLQLL
jgi:hypothetical protein